jgi:CDP-diacylglycerol pyrophosphatase
MGSAYQLLIVPKEDLNGVNPFRLTASRLGLQGLDLKRMTIAVIGALLPQGREGFYLLARAGTPTGPAAGETLLDHSCAIVGGGAG